MGRLKKNRRSFLLLMLSWMTPWKKSTKKKTPLCLFSSAPTHPPEQTKAHNPAEAESAQKHNFLLSNDTVGGGVGENLPHTASLEGDFFFEGIATSFCVEQESHFPPSPHP